VCSVYRPLLCPSQYPQVSFPNLVLPFPYICGCIHLPIESHPSGRARNQRHVLHICMLLSPIAVFLPFIARQVPDICEVDETCRFYASPGRAWVIIRAKRRQPFAHQPGVASVMCAIAACLIGYWHLTTPIQMMFRRQAQHPCCHSYAKLTEGSDSMQPPVGPPSPSEPHGDSPSLNRSSLLL
jgi:hypothetical protein